MLVWRDGKLTGTFGHCAIFVLPDGSILGIVGDAQQLTILGVQTGGVRSALKFE